MNLALVNVFGKSYTIANTGNLISDHVGAANYLAVVRQDNVLEQFIENALRQKFSRVGLPSKTAKVLSDFQQKYSKYSKNIIIEMKNVDKEINRIGCKLSKDQYLYHGGYWMWSTKLNTKVTLNKPFSTSFSPQVALRNAEHKGKIFHSGQADLLVLRAVNPKTNVFAFKHRGTMGHEKEVLFATGATLTLISRTLISSTYHSAAMVNHSLQTKAVPIYVLEVDIS